MTERKQRTTRRGFLQGSFAAGTFGAWPLAWHLHVSGAEALPTREKLNLGIIGAGGRGKANTAGVSSENIYALCDVNQEALQQAQGRHPKAKLFADWRKLIDDPQVDAVVISTADHHHALASVAAMRAGKHVYCEKPLAHTAHEARVMQQEYLKKRDRIAVQMGTQIHASGNFRRVVELIRAGALGTVREAHLWCGRSIRPVEPKLDPKPVPSSFHWDIWLGPAAERGYNAGYWKGGNLNWNRRWDFGNGVLGDMGSHLIDLPFWALGLRHPTSIESDGPAADEIACPPWQVVTWEHPQREGEPSWSGPVKVVWYHGPEGMRRKSELLQAKVGQDTDLNRWPIGVAFVGAEGVLVADYGKIVLSPAAKYARAARPPQTIEPSPGHYREWIRACKTGSVTLCNFDYSGVLIEHNLLGSVAHRASKKLQWDARGFRATNCPEASALLTKEYRNGWTL